jgi:hypothetical protein
MDMIRLMEQFGGSPDEPEETEAWNVHKTNEWGEQTCQKLDELMKDDREAYFCDIEHVPLYYVRKLSNDIFIVKKIAEDKVFSVDHLGFISEKNLGLSQEDAAAARKVLDGFLEEIRLLNKEIITEE